MRPWIAWRIPSCCEPSPHARRAPLLSGEREAEAAAAEARRQAAIEARRQAQRDLCRAVEALVAPADWHGAPARLADAETRWQSFGTDVEPDLVKRFEEARASVREAIARHEAELTEREREDRERAEHESRRADICARVERLPADAGAAALEALVQEWSAVPGDPERPLAARFEAACEGARRRARDAEALVSHFGQLHALAGDLEAVAEAPDLSSADLRTRRKALDEAWRQVPDAARTDARAAEAVARWSAARDRIRAREEEAREARTREARMAEARAEQAAEALERLMNREDATLRAVEHALKTARTAAEALDELER